MDLHMMRIRMMRIRIRMIKVSTDGEGVGMVRGWQGDGWDRMR